MCSNLTSQSSVEDINRRDIPPYIISFLSGIVMSLSMMYLPLYAYDLGASEIEVGFIAGAHSLTYVFMPILLGRLSDKIGYKRAMLYGTVIISIIYLSYFYITNPILFIPLKAVEGTGWAFIWPSLIAYFSGSRKRLRVYNMMWSFGVVVSPYIGGLIIQQSSFRNAFILSLSMMTLSFLLGATLPRINRTKTKVTSTFSSIRNNKELTLFLFPFMFGFIMLTVFTFFPIYAKEKGLEVLEGSSILTLSNLARFVAFLLPITIHKMFSGVKSLRFFTLLLGLIPATIALYMNIYFLYIELILLGLFSGLLYMSMQYKILQLDAENRGLFAGIIESTIGIGFLLAPTIGGFAASIDITYPFFLPVIAAIIILALNLLASVRVR
ncbi:MAG: MFS transporter [Nitrososphaeria archaeon]